MDTNLYDAALVHCWETLAERRFSEEAKTRLGLPAKLGGSGAQYASTRRYGAWWSSWAQCSGEVLTDTAYSTLADLLDNVPHLAQALDAARTGLAAQGCGFDESAHLADTLQRGTFTQSLVTNLVQKKLHASLLATLTPPRAAETRGAGGPGAAAFLLYPTEASCGMEDVLWSTSLRQRLQLPRAEYTEAELPRAQTHCQCRTEAGAQCGQALDEQGYHAATEQSGGGTLERHNRLKTAVGGLVSRWLNVKPLYEQRVPHWDRPSRRRGANNELERAVLDVEFVGPEGRHWLDTTVRHPAAGEPAVVQKAARKDGEATRRAEREKHERYPGQQLTPFAVETPGRLGAEARLWLLTQVRRLPADTQVRELARAYRVISCAVQASVARQLRRAAGLR